MSSRKTSEDSSLPRLTATWSPARSAWEREPPESLPCEHSALFLATWPTFGMTRSGVASELPTWAPRISDCASSSSRKMLPTPDAKLSASGPDYARATRPGSGGDDLTTTVTKHLLPTPNPFHMTNSETPDEWMERRAEVQERTGTRHGIALPVAARSVAEGHPLYQDGTGPQQWNKEPRLLPSPNARDYKGPRRPEQAALHPGPLLPEVRFDGDPTSRPSDDGRPSSAESPQPPPSPASETVPPSSSALASSSG